MLAHASAEAAEVAAAAAAIAAAVPTLHRNFWKNTVQPATEFRVCFNLGPPDECALLCSCCTRYAPAEKFFRVLFVVVHAS